MIRSIGIIPGDTTVWAPGSVSQFPDSAGGEDPPITNREGYFRYANLEDGHRITEADLGFSVRGICDGRIRGRSDDDNTNFPLDPTCLGAYKIIEGDSGGDGLSTSGHPGASIRPLLGNNPIAQTHNAITKQSDSNGFPYLAIRPSHCSIRGRNGLLGVLPNAGGAGGASEEWDDADNYGDQGGSGGGDGPQTFEFDRTCSFVPQIMSGSHTWNSSPGNEFVATAEFRFPGILPSYKLGNNNEPRWWYFVATEDAVTSNSQIYDPWYTYCMTKGGASWTPSTNLDGYDVMVGRQRSAFGFVFRIGADFTNQGGGTAYGNDWTMPQQTVSTLYSNENDSRYIAVGFVSEFDGDSDNHGKFQDWQCVAYSAHAGFDLDEIAAHSYGRKKLGPLFRVPEPVEAGEPQPWEQYHKMEVRVQDNKLSVYFDGVELGTIANIEAEFHGSSASHLATTHESDSDDDGTLDTTPFGHSGFFYSNTEAVRFKDDVGESSSDLEQAHRRLAYWYTKDWGVRENPEGTAGETAVVSDQYSPGGTQDLGNLSTELRVRSIQWLEGGPILSVPQQSIAVSGGRVYTSAGQSEFVTVSGTQDLDSSQGVVGGIEYLQKFYFVDGSNYKIYDPNATPQMSNWNAGIADAPSDLPGGDGSGGTMGGGTPDNNSRCSIISSWLGRVIMSGKGDDPQNWFMSAVGEPLDWDYNGNTAGTGAVKGSSTNRFGELASPVSALIPMAGTRLLIGGLNSLHVLTGDPLWDSSSQHAISLDVGVVGPRAWCYGPNKSVYFMSENGLYLLEPNDFDVTQSDRLSAGKFDRTFEDVMFDSVNTFLAYDYRNHGVHIFVTPTSFRTGSTTHFYYDKRANSFWPMEWPTKIGPTAIYDFRSAGPEQRRILLGGFDGHLRVFSDAAKDDDGTAISSYVWLGPVIAGPMREAKLTELVAILDEQSPDVSYEVYVADTIEGAKTSDPVYSSTWSSGRNDSRRLRARGSAIFIKVFDDSVNLPWVYERLTAVLALAGRSRQR
jgi:hypothetical protein